MQTGVFPKPYYVHQLGNPRTIDNLSPGDRACLPDHVTTSYGIREYITQGQKETRARKKPETS